MQQRQLEVSGGHRRGTAGTAPGPARLEQLRHLLLEVVRKAVLGVQRAEADAPRVALGVGRGAPPVSAVVRAVGNAVCERVQAVHHLRVQDVGELDAVLRVQQQRVLCVEAELEAVAFDESHTCRGGRQSDLVAEEQT